MYMCDVCVVCVCRCSDMSTTCMLNQGKLVSWLNFNNFLRKDIHGMCVQMVSLSDISICNEKMLMPFPIIVCIILFHCSVIMHPFTIRLSQI